MTRLFRKSLLAVLALSAATPAFAAPSESDYAAAFNQIQHVNAGVLNVGYADIGPRDGQVVILLHGWPYDIHSYAAVAPKLAAKGFRVIVPYLRGYGSTRFLSASTPRNGQPSAMAADVVALMDALKIKQAVIGGFDWGARTADIVAALWPERVKSLVSVSGYLISSQQLGQKPLPPKAELQWWYQFYFATERGRQGYTENRDAFARLIWQQASPGWTFSEATFKQAVKALDNPDQVAITLSNYRWRLGLEKGERKYDAWEQKLATLPVIPVPTITIEGDNNGAPHPAAESYRGKFSGPYQHRIFSGNIGHNPPAEAPDDFVNAISDAAALSSRR
ncbi:alpha/beta hydrolase [Enterobacter sp. Bisph1]|uniref:alpha/beta fold hydrolase n=1 Tax=Enterobacter sp. Bisph1 TaxID=1274399 RepID=UPI00057BFD35|nr:alpha/beta hydrolase [Enterobacter sp. Bisph1]